MVDVHAHEVLHMMEGCSYTSKEELKWAIAERFGAEQSFMTCSAKGLNIDALIDLLEKKGKFKPTTDGFTMDITKVCDSY
ncbi:MAG: YecH family metal-binding protein [Rikenellaceae bacterium]